MHQPRLRQAAKKTISNSAIPWREATIGDKNRLLQCSITLLKDQCFNSPSVTGHHNEGLLAVFQVVPGYGYSIVSSPTTPLTVGIPRVRHLCRLFRTLRLTGQGNTLHTTHYTLHTTHYTLHTTHYTLHTTHYTLHTTHYTLHTTHYTLHTENLKIAAPADGNMVICDSFGAPDCGFQLALK